MKTKIIINRFQLCIIIQETSRKSITYIVHNLIKYRVPTIFLIRRQSIWVKKY